MAPFERLRNSAVEAHFIARSGFLPCYPPEEKIRNGGNANLVGVLLPHSTRRRTQAHAYI